MGKDT